jgi:hypothetical protein
MKELDKKECDRWASTFDAHEDPKAKAGPIGREKRLEVLWEVSRGVKDAVTAFWDEGELQYS